MSKAHLPSSPLTIGNGSGHSFSPICTVRRSPSPLRTSCLAAPSLIAASVSSVFSSALSLAASRPSSAATASPPSVCSACLECIECRLRRIEDRRLGGRQRKTLSRVRLRRAHPAPRRCGQRDRHADRQGGRADAAGKMSASELRHDPILPCPSACVRRHVHRRRDGRRRRLAAGPACDRRRDGRRPSTCGRGWNSPWCAFRG